MNTKKYQMWMFWLVAVLVSSPLLASPMKFALQPVGEEPLQVSALAGAGVDTGKMIFFNDQMAVEVQGSIQLTEGGLVVGPVGASETCEGVRCPLPGGKRGALIALVKEAFSDQFVCAMALEPSTSLVMPCQGRLFLQVNDDQNQDNQGAFVVRLQVGPIQNSGCEKLCNEKVRSSYQACQIDCNPLPDCDKAICSAGCLFDLNRELGACLEDYCLQDAVLPKCMQGCWQKYQSCLSKNLGMCHLIGTCPDEFSTCVKQNCIH